MRDDRPPTVFDFRAYLNSALRKPGMHVTARGGPNDYHLDTVAAYLEGVAVGLRGRGDVSGYKDLRLFTIWLTYRWDLPWGSGTWASFIRDRSADEAEAMERAATLYGEFYEDEAWWNGDGKKYRNRLGGKPDDAE